MDKLSYKTYNDLMVDIKKNISKITENFDLVVGIPRSGMIPAYMIGLALTKPVCSLKEFVTRIYNKDINLTERLKLENDLKNILIVDDSVNSGNAIIKVKKIIEDSQLAHLNIKYAAVYYKGSSKHLVDYALSFCPQPRLFQWNYMNHIALENAALDIDGVLCIDPLPEQNDDGEKYIDFILNAKPLYIPQYKVAALITSRLEKYRPQTEKWLENHGVKYGKLFMLKNKTAEERKKEGLYAKHKAKAYKKLKKCNLFIESDIGQAKEISYLSKKLCFCVETDELFGNEEKTNFIIKNRPNFLFIRKIISFFIPIKKLRIKIRGGK